MALNQQTISGRVCAAPRQRGLTTRLADQQSLSHTSAALYLQSTSSQADQRVDRAPITAVMEAYHLALFGAAFAPVNTPTLGDRRKHEVPATAKKPTCQWLGGDLYLYSKDPADEPPAAQPTRKTQAKSMPAIQENAPPLTLAQKRSMLKRTRQSSRRLLDSSTKAIASATSSLKNLFSSSKPAPVVDDDVPRPKYKKLKRSSYAD